MAEMKPMKGFDLEVNAAIKKILSKENIIDFIIQTDSGAFTGPIGFTSEMMLVNITGRKQKSSRAYLNLIIKTLSTNEIKREIFGLVEMFKLELHMYDKVFPAYEHFLTLNRLPPLGIYPRFYHTFDKSIIMEDIKSSGFKHLDEVIMDDDHLRLAILECSRFHAVSFALKEKGKRKFEQIAPRNNLYFKIYRTYFRENVYNLCRKSLSILDSTTDMEAIDKLGSCIFDLDVFFESLRSHLDDKYSIIIHGDLKWHNMMFKYDVRDI